jgi:hypothetical protein
MNVCRYNRCYGNAVMGFWALWDIYKCALQTVPSLLTGSSLVFRSLVLDSANDVMRYQGRTNTVEQTCGRDKEVIRGKGDEDVKVR